MDNLFRMFNADREKNQSLRKEQWDFQNHFGETDHWNLGRPGDSNYVPFVPTYNPNARQNFPNENELVDSSNIFLPKTAEDWAKEYETDRVYQHKPATNLDPFNQVSNYGYQPNTSPFNQASNYNYQQAENNIFSPNDNTQRKLGFAESAALKASTQAKNWVNMGLSAEKAAELAKMSWSDANKLEKKQGFNPKYTGKDAVSKTNYLRQGIGSMVGQNAVPGSNVGGGTALTQKLFQNPFIKAITSNPYAARAATGLGLLGTAGMAYGAFDAGKGVANYAIDKLGVRDNLTSIGSNIAKGVEANRVHAANIKKEKDAGTFIPRQTRPAKEAEAKKKVVKKATPKRVTVNYNKNRPVAVKSKPTRTPAPKVTRTTGSRGGRGNVAKKKSAPSKSYSSYSRRVGGR